MKEKNPYLFTLRWLCTFSTLEVLGKHNPVASWAFRGLSSPCDIQAINAARTTASRAQQCWHSPRVRAWRALELPQLPVSVHIVYRPPLGPSPATRGHHRPPWGVAEPAPGWARPLSCTSAAQAAGRRSRGAAAGRRCPRGWRGWGCSLPGAWGSPRVLLGPPAAWGCHGMGHLLRIGLPAREKQHRALGGSSVNTVRESCPKGLS